MAEIIAIIVCLLIGFAFILACVIMLRNANKRKRMAADKIREEENRSNQSQSKRMTKAKMRKNSSGKAMQPE